MIELVHGLRTDYTTIVTRAVGVTTETGNRGTLPVPVPNDVDCIWLAMNGNDVNPGTQAAPKLTYAAAIGALTVSYKAVHIFRNSYIGILNFPVSVGATTLPISQHIQVEDGEIATITFATGAFTQCMGANRINGLILTQTESFSGLNNIIIIFGTSWLRLENCNIIHRGTPITWAASDPGQALQLSYCYGKFYKLNCAAHSNSWVKNSILVRSDYPGGGIDGVTLWPHLSTPNAQSILIQQSIFYGFTYGIVCADNTKIVLANAHTLELRSSVFIQCSYAMAFYEASASPNIAYHKLDYNYAYLSVLIDKYKLITAGGSASVELQQDDTLAISLPRMYTDEQAGVDGDPAGFRLQIAGKQAAGGGRYMISSPFMGDGYGGEDVAPWAESTSGPVINWVDVTSIRWEPAKLQISVNPINPAEMTDVRGSYHNTFDGIRREFTFQFESYCNNENARKLVKVMHDRGSVKFYPLGRTGSLFTDAIAGYFDTTDNSFAPSSGLGYMIPYNWQGFWIEFNGNDYYIDRNDVTKLYLVDKLGAGWPAAGFYDFAVRYVLVQPRRDAIVMNQDNFTAFTRGGAWREKADTQGAAFEYTGFAITLLETEDLVENA